MILLEITKAWRIAIGGGMATLAIAIVLALGKKMSGKRVKIDAPSESMASEGREEDDLQEDIKALLNQLYVYATLYGFKDKMPRDFPTSVLTDNVDKALAVLPDNAYYSFFIGWLAADNPAYFGLPEGSTVGMNRMLQAHHMEPENPLYKWAVSRQLGLTRSEVRNLAQQVDDSYFEGLEPALTDHFTYQLGADAEDEMLNDKC